MEDEYVSGTVDWFDPKKGYGFINGPLCNATFMTDDGKMEVFKGTTFYFHYSWIDMEGYKTLANGQAVEFLPIATAKGNRMGANPVIPIGVSITE